LVNGTRARLSTRDLSLCWPDPLAASRVPKEEIGTY
jgi:hypothetical protein